MALRLALLLLLSACSKDAASSPGPPLGRGDAVVLPNGSVYRVLQAGPVLRGTGASTGGGIMYWSDSAAPSRVSRDAQQLVAAFGPELELAGEKLLSVQAKIPGGLEGQTTTVTRGFRLERGQWLPHPPEPVPAEPIAGEAPPAPSDPVLANLAARLTAAGSAAARWLDHLDLDPVEGVVSRMNDEFRGQIKGAPERWLQITQQRRQLKLTERRSELYRMETPSKSPKLGPGDTVLVQYQSGTARRRVLERVIMVKEPAGWRVGGYAFEPLPQL